ncbi:unnamed protein product [Rhodiola kirilowii]
MDLLTVQNGAVVQIGGAAVPDGEPGIYGG